MVKKNKVALRGVMGIPEVREGTLEERAKDNLYLAAQYGQGGELMGLNSAFRKELDLYANVVK